MTTKTSRAQIESVKRYQAARDSITIRPSREIGQMIRQAAADAGQSVQQYIISRLTQDCTAAPGLPEDLIQTVTAHINGSGESTEDFLRRAVKDTIDRDTLLRRMAKR